MLPSRMPLCHHLLEACHHVSMAAITVQSIMLGLSGLSDRRATGPQLRSGPLWRLVVDPSGVGLFAL